MAFPRDPRYRSRTLSTRPSVKTKPVEIRRHVARAPGGDAGIAIEKVSSVSSRCSQQQLRSDMRGQPRNFHADRICFVLDVLGRLEAERLVIAVQDGMPADRQSFGRNTASERSSNRCSARHMPSGLETESCVKEIPSLIIIICQFVPCSILYLGMHRRIIQDISRDCGTFCKIYYRLDEIVEEEDHIRLALIEQEGLEYNGL